MLFDRILGNIADAGFSQTEPPDAVELSWDDCALPAIRKTTRAGVAVGILPPRGRSLRDGDVLRNAAGASLVVRVQPVNVWVATFANPSTLAVVALELGNLHVPVEVDGDMLIVPPDGPIREVLDRYGATVESVARIFAPLRVTVLQGVKLAEGFKVSREGG